MYPRKVEVAEMVVRRILEDDAVRGSCWHEYTRDVENGGHEHVVSEGDQGHGRAEVGKIGDSYY